jgi:alkylation response protein AidB-like acyl-CoA dehydrogenase
MSERKLFAGGEFLVADADPKDIFTPEDFSREHKMIYDAALDFVKKEVLNDVEKLEEKDEQFARELLKMAGELGLNGTDVPEEYDGEGMDKIGTNLVTEALGMAASFAVSHAAHTGIGTLPIVYFGTGEQKKKYLPRLSSGEWFAAYCLTEPNAGSDALNAQTTAVLSEDGTKYILNGEKIYITNGAWADLFMVYAKVDGEKFTGFIVERSFPGVSHGAEEKKLGIKGSSTTSVILKDCEVPVENVLYEVGKGHKIAFNILNIGRYKLGASTTGACKMVVSESAKYADTREQFGQKIGSFGMIKTKFADMSIRLYMLESMVYRLAAQYDDKMSRMDASAKKDPDENSKALEEYAIECSIAKVYGSECADFCVDEMVQIHGGNGYTSEYSAERMYRDSRINRIFEGTNEINRLFVPGTLFKRTMQNRIPLLEAIGTAEKDIKEYDPKKAPFGEEPLQNEIHMMKAMKHIALMTSGTVVNKLMNTINEEQEALAFLADMTIEIYAMESGLIRARKFLDKKGEKKAEFHIAAVTAYMYETIPKIVSWAKQALAYVEEGDKLMLLHGAIDKLAWRPPVNTVLLKRKLGEKTIKGKKYPF